MGSKIMREMTKYAFVFVCKNVTFFEVPGDALSILKHAF